MLQWCICCCKSKVVGNPYYHLFWGTQLSDGTGKNIRTVQVFIDKSGHCIKNPISVLLFIFEFWQYWGSMMAAKMPRCGCVNNSGVAFIG